MNSYSTSWWSLLLIYWPRENERLSWPCWLTYSGRFIYPYKWLPISCRSGADQRKFAGQRPTFYHWATQQLTTVCRVSAAELQAKRRFVTLSVPLTELQLATVEISDSCEFYTYIGYHLYANVIFCFCCLSVYLMLVRRNKKSWPKFNKSNKMYAGSCAVYCVGMCRIVILFWFGFWKKNSDSVWNEFGSVWCGKTLFGMDIVVIYYLCNTWIVNLQ